ncbi:hypothetical protein BO94DRAFT_563013 [Aspergillus sclerotioniger CBS 115572]|uniref:Fungal-specific transcription factor n=1 Tax=Aspergillus sclerotioniger CBS 115572 TaxID=1450535 RepID=A0A317XCT5_9EURO|nr:hypothetical protein BO94DRAFT_563013 [Aspergillus sclerotioniger CBS 115572]PWY95397.1 hypothetical protein BO94DRAFT_563013 [Aspergillus sclerotioniger CBS 115572]
MSSGNRLEAASMSFTADHVPVPPRPPLSRRRDKPQLSCNTCRRRKPVSQSMLTHYARSRCDRQHPCSGCASRGDPCVYADSQHRSARPHAPRQAVVPEMQDRLAQLERLVHSLMPGSALSSNAANESPLQDSQLDCGSMRVSASELRYVGGDHWAAILDNIAELKDHFDREEELSITTSPDDEPDSTHALLLYGCRRATSREELLEALPPRNIVDRYLSRYFNRMDLVSTSAVHGPTFLREYETFWAEPSKVPIMWLGLLFSMICLGVQASNASTLKELDAEQQALQIDLYREKVVQCLVMGEYTKCGPYVLETVIQYVYIEFCLHSDADQDIWFLLALEVNLAMRMGYHRDPSHFPGLAPVQGEMRRRLWATVLLGDILISSQMGLPRMVPHEKCDTAEPRNLNDDDLETPGAELPPSRPETEATTATGVIARRRMLVALGSISDLAATVQSSPYSEVLRVDRVLHDAASSLPPPLRIESPLGISFTDSPQVTMSRLFLRHLFYKGQLMLHRRFLFTARPAGEVDTFAYSREACISASLGALELQHILDEETSPGGQLQSLQWRVTSIINHQFLTATMILCSLLHRGSPLPQAEEIQRALRRARVSWMRRSATSREANMAVKTIRIVLSRTAEKRPAPASDGDADIGGNALDSEILDPPDLSWLADYATDDPDLPSTFLGVRGDRPDVFPFDINIQRGGNEWMGMNWPGTEW